MWAFVLAGFAALVTFASQSKKAGAGKKSYEDGLKDGEATVKKRQQDERNEELRIEKLVAKRMGQRTRLSTRRATEEEQIETPPKDEGKKE